MHIQKTTIPDNSMLREYASFKCIDAFKAGYEDEKDKIAICDITKLFFSTGPKWIDKLLDVRNSIVKSWGLKVSKNSNRHEIIQNFTCQINERIGLFTILQKNDNEIIMGEDDKHLDFRVSLLIEKQGSAKKYLTISTSVKFHNWLGKLYFIPVKPFHKKIVPYMLRAIIKELNNK